LGHIPRRCPVSRAHFLLHTLLRGYRSGELVVLALWVAEPGGGRVVHREMGNSLTGEEALRLAEERLEQMSPAEFADAYSLQPPAE
ncbi:MAG TPA: hypothetical protein VJ922_05715, partial [Actinomycetota bacterium]|nr:hypothetical protein [Actinomycetota bacterium]